MEIKWGWRKKVYPIKETLKKLKLSSNLLITQIYQIIWYENQIISGPNFWNRKLIIQNV